jgi:hypothetical protein
MSESGTGTKMMSNQEYVGVHRVPVDPHLQKILKSGYTTIIKLEWSGRFPA